MFVKASDIIVKWATGEGRQVQVSVFARNDVALRFTTDESKSSVTKFPQQLSDELSKHGYILFMKSVGNYDVGLYGETKLIKSDKTDRLKFELIGCFSHETALNALLARHKRDIVGFIEKNFYVENCSFYEGGIDEWWGIGSVTLFELGIRFSFHYVADKTIIYIKA